MDLLTLLQVAVVVMSWATFVPQALRVRRVGAAGVAPETFAVLLSASLAWSVYGLVQPDALQVIVNVPVVGVLAVIVVAALRHQPEKRARCLWQIGTVASASVAAVTVGGGAAGAVGVATIVWALAPQLAAVWRSADITGISFASWAVACAAQVGWVTYAAVTGQPWVVAGASINLGVSAVIAVVTQVRARRARVSAAL